jgi:hypothetical protein
MKSSGCSSGSTIMWFATLLLQNRIVSAYSIVAHLIRSVFVSTIAKNHLWWYWELLDNSYWMKSSGCSINLCCYWKLHDNRYWMKCSGCSSGSTIMWFATLLLTIWFFCAYNIVAHLIRSVLVSTIAKNHLWWHWKLLDNRYWMKSSGCSSGSTIIWFATLLLPFRIFQCR